MTLLERSDELAAIKALLADARREDGRALLVDGPFGTHSTRSPASTAAAQFVRIAEPENMVGITGSPALSDASRSTVAAIREVVVALGVVDDLAHRPAPRAVSARPRRPAAPGGAVLWSISSPCSVASRRPGRLRLKSRPARNMMTRLLSGRLLR